LAVGHGFEEYPPIPDAPSKSRQSLQSPNVAAERILLHLGQGGDNSLSVSCRDAIK